MCICDVTEVVLFLSLSESKFTLPVTLSYEVFSILSEFSHLDTHNKYVYDISRIVDGLLV